MLVTYKIFTLHGKLRKILIKSEKFHLKSSRFENFLMVNIFSKIKNLKEKAVPW